MIPRRNGGFTYLALLFFIATMGALLSMTGQMWSTVQQRVKERELLFIGEQFRQAIATYYEHSPGTVKRYPPTLHHLIRDERQLSTVRYLRRIYIDPMTLQHEWGLVRAPDGGVMGVFSLSERVPLKRSGFSAANVQFREARTYADWRFVYLPANAPLTQAPPDKPPVQR